MLSRTEPRPTLIVCEDDAATLELLCDHLEADRFRAIPARSATDALRLCHFKTPDLLLLDLNLPDASGLDVLREIRASEGVTGHYDPELPVIVLSGRGTDADRLRGLLCGADDYVVKPFQIQEIVVRIRAVLRRRAGRRAGPLRVGEIFVDSVRREASVAGRPVRLANKEFACQQTRDPANPLFSGGRPEPGSTLGSTPRNLGAGWTPAATCRRTAILSPRSSVNVGPRYPAG